MNNFIPKAKIIYKNNAQLFKIIIAPILLAPLPIIFRRQEAYCGFTLILMAWYWISECVPVAITSIIPVFLFPMFGILTSKLTAQVYFQDILMLYFGGLVIGIAVENTGLNERISIKIITLFGSHPLWLLLGIMIVTGALSLWISNTAAVSMMLPIVIAVVKQITKIKRKFSVIKTKNKDKETKDEANEKVLLPTNNNNNNDNDNENNNEEENENDVKVEIEPECKQPPRFDHQISQISTSSFSRTSVPDTRDSLRLMKGYIIAISYASSFGGAGTLVGTPTNLVLKGFFDDNYPNEGLSFLTFMFYAFPIAVIMILVSWIVLAFIWIPKRYIKCGRKKNSENRRDSLESLMKQKLEKLGPLSWEEGSVAALFIILIILWMTRDPYFVRGWGSLFEKKFVTDTTPAILILFFLTAWPRHNVFKGAPYEPLMTWKAINTQFPWNIILLGGGSLALAEGFEKSHLSRLIGESLQHIFPSQKEIDLILIVIFCMIGTEFTSNMSIASIFIPIADSLAKEIGINASYLLLPLTISASFSLMLPVATPTNAVIFGSGYIEIKDMVLSGAIIKLIGIGVLFLASSTWLGLIFKTDSIKIINHHLENTTSALFPFNLSNTTNSMI